MTSTPHHIEDFNELNTLLGNNFIMLCGSAISIGTTDQYGAFVPFLPMVNTASEMFFLNLHEHLTGKDYLKELLSQYALQLARGKRKSKRENRKFEDFVWMLEQILGEDNVAQFL